MGTQPTLARGKVFETWWPLAGSWLLMGAEMSLVSAAVARIGGAKVHLAAFGGVVFPVSLLIEAPIIMMLAASTALCLDYPAFKKLKRFTGVCGFGLTLVHGLVAFTGLYDAIVVTWLDIPPEVIEPGRLGLRIMLPWTWAIADRRFHQGVLIRFGRSKAVGVGSLVRLLVTGSLLAYGVALGSLPGIVVATVSLSAGVTAEMITARVLARPVIRGPLAQAPIGDRLNLDRLLRFYIPLAMTPLLHLTVQPIGAASIARMENPLANLASWPPVIGLLFLTRSMGIALNEVVVSLASHEGAERALRSFARWLAIALTVVIGSIALTPLGELWFGRVSGLKPELVRIASIAIPLGIALPALSVYQSLHTGLLVNAHQTRAVPESVAMFLTVTATCLYANVRLGVVPGVQAMLISITAGTLVQNGWLWSCQRRVGRKI